MKDSHGVIDLQLTDLKLDNVDVIEALALDLQVDFDSWSALLKDKQPVHSSSRHPCKDSPAYVEILYILSS